MSRNITDFDIFYEKKILAILEFITDLILIFIKLLKTFLHFQYDVSISKKYIMTFLVEYGSVIVKHQTILNSDLGDTSWNGTWVRLSS